MMTLETALEASERSARRLFRLGYVSPLPFFDEDDAVQVAAMTVMRRFGSIDQQRPDVAIRAYIRRMTYGAVLRQRASANAMWVRGVTGDLPGEAADRPDLLVEAAQIADQIISVVDRALSGEEWSALADLLAEAETVDRLPDAKHKVLRRRRDRVVHAAREEIEGLVSREIEVDRVVAAKLIEWKLDVDRLAAEPARSGSRSRSHA